MNIWSFNSCAEYASKVLFQEKSAQVLSDTDIKISNKFSLMF